MQPQTTPKLATTSSNWPIMALTFFIFLLILRLLLPSIILRVTNQRLQNESPVFAFHVNSLHLNLLQGEYNIEGISGVFKDTGEPFLNIHIVSVKLPWKEVFDQKFNTDLLIDRFNVVVSKKLVKQAQEEQNRLAKASPKEEKKSFINLHKIQILESSMEIQDYLDSDTKEKKEILDINLNISNATPTAKDAISNFSLSASMLGPAPLRIAGIVMRNKKPMEWDVNLEFLDLKLKAFNPMIQKEQMAFIHQGNLDLYAEAVSSGNKIKGYFKPFITKLKIDTPKSSKVIGDLLYTLLKDSEDKTLATRVPFVYEKTLVFDIVAALKKAIENKISDHIKPGLEDSIGQEGIVFGKKVKQAQEEN